MDIKFSVKHKDSKLSLYWNNDLIYTGVNEQSCISVNAVNGWNDLVIECERLDPYKNFGELTLESLVIDNTSSWPVSMAEGSILMPFSLLHGFCETENNATYLAFDNKMFTNSCQKIFFKVEDSKIVDYYHYRNLNYQDIAYSDSSGRYAFYYSEIYKKMIHRHMSADHFMMVIDPEDKSTYGSKWSGVTFEFTDSALAEDLARPESPLFPIGGTLFVSDSGIGFKKWLMCHVFGSYLYKPIPPEIVAPLLRRV